MSIRDQLLALKTAAHSFAAAHDSSACLDLVRKGEPFDQMFFSELTDPKWLPLLVQAGFFAQLPALITKADGTITYPRHLPLVGLRKLAPVAPAEVVRILESLDVPHNPAVSEQIMTVMTAIEDASVANSLVEVFKKLIRTGAPLSFLTVDELLIRWINAGQIDASIAALGIYFARAADQVLPDGRMPRAWYIRNVDKRVVPKLAEERPLAVAELVFSSLVQWAKGQRSRSKSDASGDELPEGCLESPPTYWLEQFGAPSLMSHDFEETLAHRLYFTGKIIYERNDGEQISQFDELLRRDRWALFNRLRCQLYAEFPEVSLVRARQEALAAIPHLSSQAVRHSFEFASMLSVHSHRYGSAFLNPDDVDLFCTAILHWPQESTDKADKGYIARFRRLQIYPIRSLVSPELMAKIDQEAGGPVDIPIESYKPFSSGGGARVIEHVAPPIADEMGDMSDEQLWTLLNEWRPTASGGSQWWIKEDIGALGDRFADILEAQPQRFNPAAQWWSKIRRPEILRKPLERAIGKLSPTNPDHLSTVTITDRDWLNLLGIAKWIISHFLTISDPNGEDRLDWNYANIVAVRFLKAVVTSETLVPDSSFELAGALLKDLLNAGDPQVERSEKSWQEDWLTTAINSVRGTALEGLLDYEVALRKRGSITRNGPSVFKIIEDLLRRPNESLAVFAILGWRLRLVIHLFRDEFCRTPDLLLPPDRHDERRVLIVSHVCYDNPMSEVVRTLPLLPSYALECLRQYIDNSGSKQTGNNDYGGRLGTHLAFYYWNAAFSDPETGDRILEQFFAISTSENRVSTISEIGHIFSNLEEEPNREICTRVMKLWDNRFRQIREALTAGSYSAEDVNDELSAFLNWLASECFPITWRRDRALQAIEILSKAPQAYQLVETLAEFSSSQERLPVALEILELFAIRVPNEMRWSVPSQEIQIILDRGFRSPDPECRRAAERIRDSLLSEGLFEFINVGKAE